MARMIDANEFLARLSRDTDKDHYGEFVDGSKVAFTMREIESLVSELSTITQQNEPLTWDEMCAMGKKPIYIVELEKPQKRYWALAYQVSKYGIMLASTIDLNDYGSRESYGKSWLAYRRLPEGGEDT